MAKKYFLKALSVGLSLVLCASLAAPAFAASFTDLNNAIKNEGQWKQDAFEIGEEEGTRKITLKETVENTGSEDSITVGSSDEVILDLAGYDIDYSKKADGSAIWVNGGILTLQDSKGHTDAETGEYVAAGKVTGGKNAGVYVQNNGHFTMNGGSISNNTSAYSGGVAVNGEDSSFTMNNGIISNNTAKNGAGGGGGGGVWVKAGANFVMNGGGITNNKVDGGRGAGGGVAIHQGTFTMTGGSIKDNTSAKASGIQVNATEGQDLSHFTMTGGYVKGDGDSCIYLEESSGRNAIFKLEGDAVMVGRIFLGRGTQVITKNVVQEGDGHSLLEFTVTDKGGAVLSTVDAKTTESEKGYEASEDTYLAAHYDCTYDESWHDNGDGHSYICTVCKTPKPGSAEPHSWNEGTVTTDPTCEGKGEKTFTCTDCGATKREEVAAKEHTPGDPVEEGRVEPTGTEEGRYDLVTYCTVCRTELKRETMTIPAAGAGDDENGGITSDEGGGTETPETPDDGAETPDDGSEEIEIPEVMPPLADLPEPAEPTTVIDEVEVPLSGLFTRADAIGYLWEKAGSPEAERSDFEDVSEDHQWAVAIGWAQDMGIAVADVDGSFRPDDLLLRSVEDLEIAPEGEFQEFLNRYVVFAGAAESGETFIKLDGEADDVIMGEDAQVIFDGFFAMLEEALAQAA